jgi:hypothetical protein
VFAGLRLLRGERGAGGLGFRWERGLHPLDLFHDGLHELRRAARRLDCLDDDGGMSGRYGRPDVGYQARRVTRRLLVHDGGNDGEIDAVASTSRMSWKRRSPIPMSGCHSSS